VTADGRVKVLIADDHAPTRAELRETIEADERFVVVAEAADAPEAVEAAVREQPDICLLDIQMPGNGVSAVWEITGRLPSTHVVMLTVSRDERHLFAALRAGAAAYLLKDMDTRRLPHALCDVMEGETAIPRRLMRQIVDEFRDRSARRRDVVPEVAGAQLTSREWEVLDLLRRGESTAEIARRLVLSPVTVRTHVAAVLRKLRVADREAAVRLFEQAH
jgi:DNA-binding NarL/FixJ family response regulator